MLEGHAGGEPTHRTAGGPGDRPGSLMPPAKLWSTFCGARAHRMPDPRIVTLLFTDVEASTRLLGSLGDSFVALIERHRAILTSAATARRGSGYPTGGDGCAFIFGSAGDAGGAGVEAPAAPARDASPGGPPVRGQ